MAKTSDTLKLAKLQAKERQKDRIYGIAQRVIASPMTQVMGTVAIAEVLEKAGILSGRWAGAIEGSVLTMTFLQALKDYGTAGAGLVGVSTGIGALTEGTWEGFKDLMLGGAIMGENAPLSKFYDYTLGKVI